MRDYKMELRNRTEFIRDVLARSGCHGIVYGNSGGKDSTLVGILCRKACRNVLGVIMPCSVKQNLQRDREDAILLATQFGIETITVDLGPAKEALCAAARQEINFSDAAKLNIAPRLRMTMLYTIAQSKNYLVAGTTNRSERHIGYFTKWGDGACDFDPISDLTVREVYEFLHDLGAPGRIMEKAPSAGLFQGQRDEEDLGLSYRELDAYLLQGEGNPQTVGKIGLLHQRSEHKRQLPVVYRAPSQGLM